MTNAMHSHTHGLTTMNQSRPKSKLRKRANKAKAKVRSEARQSAIKQAKEAHQK
ncbi:MAG: hypothetical protein ACD_51C00249G0005 [uncultured bacterium]|nr:MAG: hypothetical protein ACD_51C00249G0005 [uncultured bacterium]